MRCPFCKRSKTKVNDKRSCEENTVVRRRRECLKCKKRFTTYEKMEGIALTVLKKDGRKEYFDKNKIEQGMLKACEKRPVSLEEIRKAVAEIERNLLNKGAAEIKSAVIGKLVLGRLKRIDKVSYIRFASVYKDFKGPEEFQKELWKLR